MKKENIKLYFEEFLSRAYRHKDEEEALLLVTDPWDDYGYRTQFHVYFVDSESSKYYIGAIKIFTSKEKITSNVVKINEYFDRFDDTFYSLGQSYDFYARLKIHLRDYYDEVLERIRDIATNSTYLYELKDNYWSAYINSLVRESTASSALNIISKETKTYYSFIFENKITEEIIQKCSFNFSENAYLPYRINAIIGKNATGKTKYLSSLAQCLHSKSDIVNNNYRLEPLEEKYKSIIHQENYIEYLGFSNYITVSFNAFDDFYQPVDNELQIFKTLVNQAKYYLSSNKQEVLELLSKEKKDNHHYLEFIESLGVVNFGKDSNTLSSNIESYKYIGLRKDNVINTDYYLYCEILNSLRMILMYDHYYDGSDAAFKSDILEKFIYEVLYNEEEVKALAFHKKIEEICSEIKENYDIFINNITFNDELIWKLQNVIKQMSSGQNMIFYVYLNIISNITESSLLLIDEPETHLHPNAISIFVNFLYELLNQYSSYAIITTHSPLVIQEIPSSYISVFRNIEGDHYTNMVNIETFGANISNIVQDVFCISEKESNFKKYLSKMVENEMGFTEILNLFDGNLSLDVKLFLKNLYKKHGDKNDEI